MMKTIETKKIEEINTLKKQKSYNHTHRAMDIIVTSMTAMYIKTLEISLASNPTNMDEIHLTIWPLLNSAI